MAMDFPIDPVDRLPIFPEEASRAAAQIGLVGGAAGLDDDSANGSREGEVVRSLSKQIRGAAPYGKQPSVATAGGAMSMFSESEGDKADFIEQEAVKVPLMKTNLMLLVIQEHAGSDDAASAQSRGMKEPQEPGCRN